VRGCVYSSELRTVPRYKEYVLAFELEDIAKHLESLGI
jgi:hypothetical protein